MSAHAPSAPTPLSALQRRFHAVRDQSLALAAPILANASINTIAT